MGRVRSAGLSALSRLSIGLLLWCAARACGASLPADFTQWLPDEKEPTAHCAFRVSAIADVQFLGDTAAVTIPLLPPVHVTHPNIQAVLSFGAPDTILHPK